jgi:molybdenum cofactor cytidylyltransferase
VIEHVIGALRSAGVERVVVVVGPQVPEVASLSQAAGAEVVRLPEPTPDMRATVERGLEWLESRYRPSPAQPWLLVPADCPMLRPAVIRELLAVDAPDSIVIPAHGGRRGHPTRFAWRHAAGVRALPVGEGINAFVRAQAKVIELPVDEPGVLADLDTPEDYERLVRPGGA